VHDNSFWGKRQSDNLFDVTIGSHDGAETCELVGNAMQYMICLKYWSCVKKRCCITGFLLLVILFQKNSYNGNWFIGYKLE